MKIIKSKTSVLLLTILIVLFSLADVVPAFGAEPSETVQTISDESLTEADDKVVEKDDEEIISEENTNPEIKEESEDSDEVSDPDEKSDEESASLEDGDGYFYIDESQSDLTRLVLRGDYTTDYMLVSLHCDKNHRFEIDLCGYTLSLQKGLTEKENKFTDLYIHNGTIVFNNSTPSDMTVLDHGLRLENVTFQNYNGSCMFYMQNNRDEKSIDVNYCRFIDCRFNHDGGAFYFNNYGPKQLNFNRTSFIRCQNQRGSILCFYDLFANGRSEANPAEVNMNGCVFDHCESLGMGACIYIGSRYINISNMHGTDRNLCIYCKSGTYGGAIYDDYGRGRIADFTFYNCDCNYNGGAVYLASNGRTVENCDFIYNHAGSHCGAIYDNGSTNAISDCWFYENRADSTGKCINDVYNVKNSKFYQQNGEDYFSSPISYYKDKHYIDGNTSFGTLPTLSGDGTDASPYILSSIRDITTFYMNIDHNATNYRNAIYRMTVNNLCWHLPMVDTRGEIGFNGIINNDFIKEVYSLVPVTDVFPGNEANYRKLIVRDFLGNSRIFNGNYQEKYYAVENGKYVERTASNMICIQPEKERLVLNDGFYLLSESLTFLDRINVTGNANLVLANDTVLRAGNGFYIQKGASLTVFTQTTDPEHFGKIDASCVGNNAAIGGDDANGDAGSFNLHGGIINAFSRDGNGIGGQNGSGTVNILGGNLTINAKKIGIGANKGDGTQINLSGANLDITAGELGIGSAEGSGVKIKIDSGNILINAETTGIGVLSQGKGGTVELCGGTTKIKSKDVGIGGNSGEKGLTVLISDGQLDIDTPRTGIGGTENGAGSDVTISGGSVNIKAGLNGIGGGTGKKANYNSHRLAAKGGSGGTVNITGGCVRIEAGQYGIGGGLGGAYDHGAVMIPPFVPRDAKHILDGGDGGAGGTVTFAGGEIEIKANKGTICAGEGGNCYDGSIPVAENPWEERYYPRHGARGPAVTVNYLNGMAASISTNAEKPGAYYDYPGEKGGEKARYELIKKVDGPFKHIYCRVENGMAVCDTCTDRVPGHLLALSVFVHYDKVSPTRDEPGCKEYYGYDGLYYENLKDFRFIEDLSAWKAEGGGGYIPPLGCPHEGTTVDSYEWNETHTSCKAIRHCYDCDTDILTEQAKKIELIETVPGENCTVKGKGYYKASFKSFESTQTESLFDTKFGPHIYIDFICKYCETVQPLKEAKVSSKAEIDAAAGEKPNAAITALVNSAKIAIDKANNHEELLKIRNYWIAAIKRLQGGDEETTSIEIIIENMEEWTKNSSEGLILSCEIPLDQFVAVFMDGELIDEDWFELSSSEKTVLDLLPRYLATLAPGKHTLEFLFADGTIASTQIKISGSYSPNTGDESNSVLLFTLCISALMIMAVCTAKLRSRAKK